MNDSVKIVPNCIVGFSHPLKKGIARAVDDRSGMELMMYRYGKPRIPAILPQGIARHFGMPDVMDGVIVHGGDPPSTHMTSYEAWGIMQERGWETCVVLAHKDDVSTCVAAMQSLGAIVVGTITVEIDGL